MCARLERRGGVRNSPSIWLCRATCQTPLLGAGLSQGTVLPTVGKQGPGDIHNRIDRVYLILLVVVYKGRACLMYICYGPYQNSGSINAARSVLILTGGPGSINAARAVLILTGESVSINTDRFTRAVLILPVFCPRTYHALARGISNTA